MTYQVWKDGKPLFNATAFVESTINGELAIVTLQRTGPADTAELDRLRKVEAFARDACDELQGHGLFAVDALRAVLEAK